MVFDLILRRKAWRVSASLEMEQRLTLMVLEASSESSSLCSLRMPLKFSEHHTSFHLPAFTRRFSQPSPAIWGSNSPDSGWRQSASSAALCLPPSALMKPKVRPWLRSGCGSGSRAGLSGASVSDTEDTSLSCEMVSLSSITAESAVVCRSFCDGGGA